MGSGTFYPAVSIDDGNCPPTGAYDSSSNFMYLGAPGGTSYEQWIRFPSVNIPIGATITGAFIRLTCVISESNTICNLNLYFNNIDDAIAPVDKTAFQSLALTGAISWNDLAAWTDGVKYDSPSLVDILQTVVDRGGWVDSNAVQVVIKNNASSSNAFRQASTFDIFSGAEKAELHVTWTVPSIINLTEPLSSETSIQSDIEIIVTQAQLSSVGSMSVGSVFVGVRVDCPYQLTGTSSLQSAVEINIPSISLNAQSEILSNTQINIPSITLTTTSLISVSEILQAYLVDCPLPFSAQANLQSSLQIGVSQSLFTSNGSLYVQPEIQLFAGSLPATGSISAIITDPFSVAILPRVYTFTLTGAADGVEDIVIPIKSFQSRLKSGDPTYLSVVIPGIDYASAINLRLNGDLVVRMGYLSGGEIVLSEIISIVDFENIIIYDGTINKTITLDGHRTETFTPKEINLTGSSYRNLTAGKLRYRCTPNLYVRPGDTVSIDDDSFTIKNITYSVSPELETFEVSE